MPQRELKFRAWSSFNAEPDPIMVYFCPPDGSLADLVTSDEWKVMQFTGLKDSDGRDIYEGDIVWAHDRHKDLGSIKGEVKYGDGWYYVDDGIKALAFSEIWIGNGFGEVLGNIYENPELLK